MRPEDIDALLFDVGGTVFDWRTGTMPLVEDIVRARSGALDAAVIARDWHRTGFAVMDEVRIADRPFADMDELRRIAARRVNGRHPGLDLTEADMERMNAAWRELPPFSDSVEALRRLRTRFKVVVMTVQRFGTILDASKKAGIVWDGIISCEFLGVYKPSLESYRRGAALVGVPRDRCLMVGAHAGDARAGRLAGLKAAFIMRDTEYGPKDEVPELPISGVDMNATSLADLADQLDC
jgi:2-haloacid dehalogenase